MGEFYVYGGKDSHMRQISKVENCGLRRKGDLEFDFSIGTCNNYSINEENPYVLLCFPKGATKLCRKFDGYEWTELSQTGYPHDFTYALGSYNDQPFITGAYSNIKTEVY